MRSELMLPHVALVDPELTHSMPPSLTATTGLDALTQLLEAFVTPRANPFTDGLCREGLASAARSLRTVYHDGHNVEARADMALASLFSGLALANASLGAVHGFAGPLGGLFSAPHGALCARLLPFVMEANITAMPSPKRYDEVARLVTGRSEAVAGDGVAWVRELGDELNVPSLSSYGITPDDFPGVVDKAEAAISMKGNPVKLSREALWQVLSQAL
jgi:alcohol dehydrogenase class IV